MDHTFLDAILQAFTVIITGGFLRVHPWVMTLLASMVAMAMIGGFFVAALQPGPRALAFAGQVMLRAFILIGIANNWLWITDGFLNSVVWLGSQIGHTTMTPTELLSPGRVFFLGTMLSWNLFQILLDLKWQVWGEPLLGISYTFAWFVLWLAFGLMAAYVLLAVIEFQLLSVYAFLMWPFMTVRLLAFLAEPLARALLGSALRLSAIAALLSILIPFALDLGIPDEEPTVQGAMTMGVGVLVLFSILWIGPKQIGASAWPGTNLVTMGALTWMGLRRL